MNCYILNIFLLFYFLLEREREEREEREEEKREKREKKREKPSLSLTNSQVGKEK